MNTKEPVIHEVTADWLAAKCETGEPRVEIRDGQVISRDKHSGEIVGTNPLVAYRMTRFSFRIVCTGESCTWSHADQPSPLAKKRPA